MSRFPFIYALFALPLIAILAACVPAAPATLTTDVATPRVSTAISGTAITNTGPPPPPTTHPLSTPMPVLVGGLGPTELKYQVLAEFPNFFYCDPDEFPVSRGDELERALQSFPEIQANAEEFNAILINNNLSGQSKFNDGQKMLIYREHKRLAALPFELTDNAYRFQLQSGEEEGNGELITGIIDGQGSITLQQKESIFITCPICLATGTLIDTPHGLVPVESLREGRLVWTLNDTGMRVAVPLVRIGRTIVPVTHRVVHLLLDDGRELWVSPGHPTTDERAAGQLQAGDSLDGGKVIKTERITYAGYATYDLLPEGDTGYYWANGILMASTLRNEIK